jgi:hypothetical protein
MSIFTILEKPIFHPRYKLPVHVAQVVLVAVAMGCSVPRLFMKNQPRTRANTIALGMVRLPHLQFSLLIRNSGGIHRYITQSKSRHSYIIS